MFHFNSTNAFCISLETAPERRAKMERRLSTIGLNVTMWKASTRDNLVDNFHDNLNGGQRACAQSHIHIWRKIVQDQMGYALILEDDACFDQHWKEKLADLSLETDPEWQMVLLNASEPVNPPNVWCMVKEQYLTGGYILSLSGAETLLRVWDGNFAASDWMTSRLQEYGHTYCYFPWLVIQEGCDSLIGSGVDADHKKVLRCLNELNYSLDNYVI